MPTQSEPDERLLERFKATRSEEAFRALVEKYLGLVFGLALRRTGQNTLAEEVTQNVFTALARRATCLEARPTLAGWLYRCAMFESANVLRRELAHERKMKAFSEHTRTSADGDSVWREALPLLDEAIGALSAADRNLILLRFFERRSFGEIGVAAAKSSEAARKQCDRALQKLAHLLARRGVAVPTTVLTAGLASHLAHAAPAGLTWTISKCALTGVSTLGAKSLILKTLNLMAHTKTKVALVVAIATAIPLALQWHQNHSLRRELAQLRQQSVAADTAQPVTASSRTTRTEMFAPRRADVTPSTAPSLAPAEAAAAWEQALVERDPLRRSHRISELLAALTADTAPAIVQVFERMRSVGHKFDSEFRLFLRTWGKLDGAVAVAYALGTGGNDMAQKLSSSELGAALAGWASADPLAARGWIEGLPEGEGKEVGIYALLDGWSLLDFDAASAFAASRPRSAARNHFRVLLLERALTSGGVAEVQRWFQGIPDDDHNQLYKLRAFEDVIRAMLYRDPSAAAQWISLNAGARYLADSAVTETAARLAQSSPTETLRWLESLQSVAPEKASKGIKSVLHDWARRDAGAAAAFLQQQATQPAYDTMADAYARGLVATDPQSALAWAQSLRDESQRAASVTALAGAWVRAEGESALAKLRAAGYPEEFIASLPRSTAREVMSFVATAPASSSTGGTGVWRDYARESSPVKLNSQSRDLVEYRYLSTDTQASAEAELAARNSLKLKEEN
ncbi:MAG: sigma-70 family RNA polymerase sigma factor [Verrucomicrobiales bacterium]|nr:sigma-70 family RNA polymerase sigma factor [Verrucomicrobiales bacterium]